MADQSKSVVLDRPRIVTDQLPREIQTKDVFHCDIDIGVSA